MLQTWMTPQIMLIHLASHSSDMGSDPPLRPLWLSCCSAMMNRTSGPGEQWGKMLEYCSYSYSFVSLLYLITDTSYTWLDSQSRDIQTNPWWRCENNWFIFFVQCGRLVMVRMRLLSPPLWLVVPWLSSSISMKINEQQKPAWAKPSLKWGSKNTSWSVHLYQPLSFSFSFLFL